MVSHDQVDCVYFTSLYNMYTCNFHNFRDIGHCFQDTTSSCLSNRICKDPVESILVCSGRQGQLKIYSSLRIVTLSD